jgi:acyl dehydratase
MAIDYQKLLHWPFPEVVHTYTEKDAILYALGVGMGADPLDLDELPYVYEAGQVGLRALPTYAVVLAYPGFWIQDPATGVDWKRVLHGEQGLVLHKALPAAGTVRARTRVDAVVDKGAGKGALVYSSRYIVDDATGELLGTVTSTTFCRGDGGFGGSVGTASGAGGTSPRKALPKVPGRPFDRTCDLVTLHRAALLYRLSGDFNPLHADPAVAREAGFERPILHGLATYAAAGRALLKTYCDHRPERLKRLDVRFTSPVYPGETIRTEMWSDAGGPGNARTVAFRARVVERDVVVLDNGFAEVAG